MGKRKIINDPVHGFITLDDELLLSVINHKYYQRLRNIKQMALAYLVYPGAMHTRFQHSLGAYHLVSLALNELIAKGHNITKEEILGTKLAILLHDIGHGPFSHALEQTLIDVHHEDISLLVMQQLNTTFKGALDIAIEIFTDKHPKKFLHQLVSSQLDADRLDYLARDSFFTGVSEGVIGYDRIIKMLNVVDNQLVVEEKGIHSIEKFLIARTLMYWQVYLHKTVLSSESMMVKILQRARELQAQGEQLFATPALSYFLQNKVNQQTIKNDPTVFELFMQLDDFDIFSSIKVWRHHTDLILSELCTRLVSRNLYKCIIASSEDKLPSAEELLAHKNISSETLHYYYVKGTTSNMAYNDVHEPIKVLMKNEEIKNINDIDHSLIDGSLEEPVKKFYICYAK